MTAYGRTTGRRPTAERYGQSADDKPGSRHCPTLARIQRGCLRGCLSISRAARWRPARLLQASQTTRRGKTGRPLSLSRCHSAQRDNAEAPGGWEPARRRTGPRPYRLRMMILTRRVRTTRIIGRSLCGFIALSPAGRWRGNSCRRFRLTGYALTTGQPGAAGSRSGLQPPVPLNAPAPQERGRLSHRR
jgi:hypothetical protein